MSDQHATNHPHDGHGGEVPYETRDASVRGLLLFGVGLVLATGVIEFIMYRMYGIFRHETTVAQLETGEAPDSKTNLYNLYKQLDRLHEDEKQALGGYSWVDRKAGVVRIPIDRAMEVVASKGVRFGKGRKTEVELNSHGGTPAPPSVGGPSANLGDIVKPPTPPDTAGPKP